MFKEPWPRQKSERNALTQSPRSRPQQVQPSMFPPRGWPQCESARSKHGATRRLSRGIGPGLRGLVCVFASLRPTTWQADSGCCPIGFSLGLFRDLELSGPGGCLWGSPGIWRSQVLSGALSGDPCGLPGFSLGLSLWGSPGLGSLSGALFRTWGRGSLWGRGCLQRRLWGSPGTWRSEGFSPGLSLGIPSLSLSGARPLRFSLRDSAGAVRPAHVLRSGSAGAVRPAHVLRGGIRCSSRSRHSIIICSGAVVLQYYIMRCCATTQYDNMANGMMVWYKLVIM